MFLCGSLLVLLKYPCTYTGYGALVFPISLLLPAGENRCSFVEVFEVFDRASLKLPLDHSLKLPLERIVNQKCPSKSPFEIAIASNVLDIRNLKR